MPSNAVVETNWFAVENTVTFCSEPYGCHDEKQFGETNTYVKFQLDRQAKAVFQLSTSNDDLNPQVLVRLNESVVDDFRKSTKDRLELGICRQRKSELPGLTTQGQLPAVELEALQKLYPGRKLDPCRGNEELGSFILRGKNYELLGSGYCGGGKRPCDATIFTGPTEAIRILFHRTEFPFLQQHAEALVEYMNKATISGNRCYVRQNRPSDVILVAKDSACSGQEGDVLK